jgi:hypothetical protein
VVRTRATVANGAQREHIPGKPPELDKAIAALPDR